jgi:hypothetical protein
MKRHSTYVFPLAAMLALVLAGAAAVQVTTVRYLHPVEVLSPSISEYEAVKLPRLERLRMPHAILVLDVSGSMQTSDPKRWQALAVEQFYTAYRDLAREITPPGEPARIAVILFSTLAQVMDWDGTGMPWLEVSRDNSDRFFSAVRAGIGSASKDARSGQDTDYLAALTEVARLADGLPSPPAVIFVTDGGNEPHGLFTPALTRAERERLFPEAIKASRLLDDIEAGRYRYLRLPGASAFDRRQFGLGQRQLHGELLERTRRAAGDALTALQTQRFWLSEEHPATPLFWLPVFLDAGAEPAGEIDVRELLVGHAANGAWDAKPDFLVCRDARDLSGQFISALAAWLRMARREVEPMAGGVQVPADSLAFALSVETERAGSHFDLVSGNRRLPLTGRDGVWAGVSPGGGEWRFETDGRSVRGGMMFYRPRYRWILHAPRLQTVDGQSDTIPVELYLLSIENGKPVVAATVYSEFPAELPVRAIFQPDGQTISFRLARAEVSADAAYRGWLPLNGRMSGSSEITVDLSELARHGIAVESQTLFHRVELRSALRATVTTADGKPSGLGASGVPREGESVRRAWRKVRGGSER